MDYTTYYYNPNNINNHHPSPIQSLTPIFLPSSSSPSPSSSSSFSSRRAKNNTNTDTNTNTDKKQKKKKGVMRLSTDPQSVAARERRHRISDRFKTLQSLVPGGAKLDTVSMLERAIQYVKFLKAQIWLHQTIIINNNNNNNNDNDNNNNNDIYNDVIYSYYNEDNSMVENMMGQETAVFEAATMADFSGYEMLCEGIDNGSMYYCKRSPSFEYYGIN